jgi:branched-chain amino acid aminotransferase
VKAEIDPKIIVYFDGHFIPLREARIGILTHALHYGTGVFEGIRAHWNEREEELFLMRPLDHFVRWKQNCGIMHVEVPRAVEELCEITIELARRNGFHTDLYIRPLAYKCAEGVGVAMDEQDAFFIVALPFGEYLHSDDGLHACVSGWRRIEDNAIPARGKICGAYANSALASDEARRNGFDEAILLNEAGHVTEGATCNLFMARKGHLISPSVTENVLEGITRDSLIELAQHEFGLKVEERPIDRSELYICDELFLSGTAVGVAPVTRVDHRPVGTGAVGEITGNLRRLYRRATRGLMPAYRKWLVPVYEKDLQRQEGVAETASAISG